MVLAHGYLETLAPGDQTVLALDGRKAMAFEDWTVPTHCGWEMVAFGG